MLLQAQPTTRITTSVLGTRPVAAYVAEQYRKRNKLLELRAITWT
jgi:hypothetical protein